MTVPRQPFPRGPYSVGKIGEVGRILDAKGNDVMTMPGGPERLVECANALVKVWFPKAHVDATDEYCRRVEGLRKDAYARVVELEAIIAAYGLHHESPSPAVSPAEAKTGALCPPPQGAPVEVSGGAS